MDDQETFQDTLHSIHVAAVSTSCGVSPPHSITSHDLLANFCDALGFRCANAALAGGARCCAYAARGGHLEVLNGRRRTAACGTLVTCLAAAQGGHLAVCSGRGSTATYGTRRTCKCSYEGETRRNLNTVGHKLGT